MALMAALAEGALEEVGLTSSPSDRFDMAPLAVFTNTH